MINFRAQEAQKIRESYSLAERARIIGDQKKLIVPEKEEFLTPKFLAALSEGSIRVPTKRTDGTFYSTNMGYSARALYMILRNEYPSTEAMAIDTLITPENLPNEYYLIAMIHQHVPSAALSRNIDASRQTVEGISDKGLDVINQSVARKPVSLKNPDAVEWEKVADLFYAVNDFMKSFKEFTESISAECMKSNSALLDHCIKDADAIIIFKKAD
jgi:hypothetical protein